MSLEVMKWVTVPFGIWALQERGILRGPYHTDPQVYSMMGAITILLHHKPWNHF